MLNEFVRVASTSDLQSNGMMSIAIGSDELLLVRIDEAYYALDGWCSHEAGLLGDGYLHEDTCEVECPVHEGFFNLKTGAATALPADMPVQIYAVRIEGEDVLVGPLS